jgi:hypothetical protein
LYFRTRASAGELAKAADGTLTWEDLLSAPQVTLERADDEGGPYIIATFVGTRHDDRQEKFERAVTQEWVRGFVASAIIVEEE